ncbi:hypothetical protein GW17_00048184 [Ensete ventricosum]|nr:hypothetical protein GW17_00048184 [Ensete ventricosum]
MMGWECGHEKVSLLVEADATAVEHEEDCLVQDSSLMRQGRSGRRRWGEGQYSAFAHCSKRAYFVTGSVEGARRQRRQELRWQEKWQLYRRLLLSRMSKREICRWEEMAHDCSSYSGSYCAQPDAMGCEERLERDGLSFDSEEGVAGNAAVATGDGDGCDGGSDPFAVAHAATELTMGAARDEEKGVEVV